MKLSLNNLDAIQVDSDCLVVGVFEATNLQGSAAEVNEACNGELQSLIDSDDVDACWKQTTLLHGLKGVTSRRVLVVGLGKPEELNPVRYDAVCTAAGGYLRDNIANHAHICLHEVEVENKNSAWRLRQAAIAITGANYKYTTTKVPASKSPAPIGHLSFSGNDALQTTLTEASGIASGYALSKELGNLPPNICTPAYLAGIATGFISTYDNVSVNILKRKAMKKLKMSALLAVGQGSSNGPRLIVLEYKGKTDDSQPVVLVGKGITFDTGGISLKAGANMEQMKFDMGGAASVLGAFAACAELQLPINLVAIVASAENMPDGKAYRPGDVLTSMSGQTIEVLNTDAEGRLVLCDALTYSERFKPSALIDVATLTGACVMALGHHASAVMSKHDDLSAELLDAGNEIIDRGWPLPIWDDYQPQLKSNFADMKNVGGMAAGSITAGCFLSRFTKKQRWAHIDCAGSTWVWGSDKGSTGRPVGLLTQFLINQAG